MILLAALTAAHATVHPDLLGPDPADDTLLQGPREPAVAYSETLDLYVAVWAYEDPTLSDASCPDGVWSLGWATSPDGLSWTSAGAPVLQPAPGSGTYWDCMAREPTAVFDGDQLLVWFVADQGDFGTPSRTGLGHAVVDLDPLSGLPLAVTPSATEAWVSDTVDRPGAMLDGGTAWVMVEDAAGLTTVSGPPAALSVLSSGTPGPGAYTTWATDAVRNPVLTCVENTTFPIEALLGGKASGAFSIGKGLSSTGITWILAVDPEIGPRANAPRSFDAMVLGVTDVLLYLEVPVAGGSSLAAASPGASWSNTDVGGRSCP